jgi:putative endonuclease
MFYVYIIHSFESNKKYIGQTENIERRLNEHNNGLLGTYTKNKGPWQLIHSEQYNTRVEAMLRTTLLSI